MAGGVYDSLNFEQNNSKWPEVKILFILDLQNYLQNVSVFYLVKGFFYIKYSV